MRRLRGALLLAPSRHICTLSTANLNDMINGYIRNGRLDVARELFDRNPASRDIISWNSMIAGYVKKDQIQHAQDLFDQMPIRDVVSWNTILSGLHKNPERVYQSFLQMLSVGVKPSQFTMSIAIAALSNTELTVLLPQLHVCIICLALNHNPHVGSALMKGYANVGDCIALRLVFDEILVKDIASWNALIMGYMELGCTGEAHRMFEEMPERDIVSWITLVKGYIANKNLNRARWVFNQMSKRNVVSWTVMISGYVHNGCSSLLVGKQVHSSILKSGMPLDVVSLTSLVDMYAKCGDIGAAFSIFESMPTKNLVSWNSIIGAYAKHGLGIRALEEFEKMTGCGVRPDHVTFVNVLSACARGGLVDKGERQFKFMETNYGIRARVEHYACMVDLYGKAGHLEKAEKLIKGMPCEPDVVVWGAMLGACVLYSNLELGKFAAEEICKLEEDHPVACSMLSKIHGEKGV
ncbi:pentatricopeptide repeat-containing protein At4g02750-like [Malania oleifera]|uniref:pentatricopeptide repeat-containing protein At4g02750-like n=1 Tax=Malania oleifera TaxID=397392 RepID=UPI0025AE3265|nr:pentatricopeptide repeat-containing protein At4g02750-like [Malania oleifera]